MKIIATILTPRPLDEHDLFLLAARKRLGLHVVIVPASYDAAAVQARLIFRGVADVALIARRLTPQQTARLIDAEPADLLIL